MNSKVCFSEWANNWLETVKGTVKANTYQATYRNTVVNHLIPEFGDRYLDEIKPYELQQFLNRSSEKYCHDTVKKFKSCLVQIFDEAVYNDFCEKNPCYRLKVIKQLTTEEQTIHTPQQIDLIQDFALTHRFGLDIMLLSETGMRRGELLGLIWENIDLSNKAIYIKQAAAIVKNNDGKNTVVIGAPKNKSSIRVIPISSQFATYLANKKRSVNARSQDFVIRNYNSTVCNPRTWQRRHYDVFMHDMQQYYLKQGVFIPIYTPHNLRHSRASAWVNNGLNLYAVARALGHADLDMLRKRYAHSDIEQLRQLLQIV